MMMLCSKASIKRKDLCWQDLSEWESVADMPSRLGEVAGSYEDSMVFTFWVHCIISAGFFEMIPVDRNSFVLTTFCGGSFH